MGVVATAQRMTADDFLALPELPGVRFRQLIDGEVVVNAPAWMHGDSQIAILAALRNWVRTGAARGAVNVPIDVLLDDRNVYEPDVVWYRAGRAPLRADPPPYAPPDIGVKKTIYERHGVAELWLVDTAADVVLVFRRSSLESPEFDVSEELDTDAILRSGLLPGFALPVAEIFGG
jgi:Uma2 family endonuclease